jgi:hypothetical protein
VSIPKSGQFGEPWRADDSILGHLLFGGNGECIPMTDAQLDRAAACVTALNGRDPEALKGLIEAAQNADVVLSRYITLTDSAGIAATNILHAALAAFGASK